MSFKFNQLNYVKLSKSQNFNVTIFFTFFYVMVFKLNENSICIIFQKNFAQYNLISMQQDSITFTKLKMRIVLNLIRNEIVLRK